jgi:hypothetical protein
MFILGSGMYDDDTCNESAFVDTFRVTHLPGLFAVLRGFKVADRRYLRFYPKDLAEDTSVVHATTQVKIGLNRVIRGACGNRQVSPGAPAITKQTRVKKHTHPHSGFHISLISCTKLLW